MIALRRLSLLLALALPIGLAPGCAPTTSTKGQLIQCDVGDGGVIASCKPTTDSTTSDPNQCIDVDEDGDDQPHDDADEVDDDGDDHDDLTRFESPGDSDDDDGDGTPDEMDEDDDNDGIADADDCDERQGGDDDDGDDLR